MRLEPPVVGPLFHYDIDLRDCFVDVEGLHAPLWAHAVLLWLLLLQVFGVVERAPNRGWTVHLNILHLHLLFIDFN